MEILDVHICVVRSVPLYLCVIIKLMYQTKFSDYDFQTENSTHTQIHVRVNTFHNNGCVSYSFFSHFFCDNHDKLSNFEMNRIDVWHKQPYFSVCVNWYDDNLCIVNTGSRFGEEFGAQKQPLLKWSKRPLFDWKTLLWIMSFFQKKHFLMFDTIHWNP